MSTWARFSRRSDPIAYRSGRLCVEGVSAEEIARKVGTPVYVYSAGSIRERYRRLDAAFSKRDHLICYALKANSNLSVCRLLAGLSAGADVVSGGELRRALTAGFEPSRIMLSGVGKTEDEIATALKARILALNVESEEELEAVARVARRMKQVAPVSARVNPDVDAHTHGHITTGRSDNKFGIDRSRVAALFRRVRKNAWLHAVGIQCHIGSQITQVGPYVRALRVVTAIVSELAREGMRFQFVDIGGGMGIRYRDENPLAVAKLAGEVTRILKPWPALTVLMEPGRYLTADAGVLLTKVLYRKTTPRARFVIVDAAMNDLMRPALYGAYHPILPAVRSRSPEVKLDVVGPVCETADRFAKGRKLPWPEPGDLWAVLKAGAYGSSMSSQYNSRPRPPEILVDGKSWRLIAKRETFEDLVRRER